MRSKGRGSPFALFVSRATSRSSPTDGISSPSQRQRLVVRSYREISLVHGHFTVYRDKTWKVGPLKIALCTACPKLWNATAAGRGLYRRFDVEVHLNDFATVIIVCMLSSSTRFLRHCNDEDVRQSPPPPFSCAFRSNRQEPHPMGP